jgi:hypothetical protein
MLVADLDERDVLRMSGDMRTDMLVLCIISFISLREPLCYHEGHSPRRVNISKKKKACLGRVYAESRRGSRALAKVIAWLVSLEEASR